MASIQSVIETADRAAAAGTRISGFSPIGATDVEEFTHQVRDWHFEFTQLKPGQFAAHGAMAQFDGVSVAHASINRTLVHAGGAPRHMLAILIPGSGSGQVFVGGQLLDAGQCITLSEGASLQEAVTHDRYEDVAFGFDLEACCVQLTSLNDSVIGTSPGTAIAAPGLSWMDDMVRRVGWLLASVVDYPEALSEGARRAALADHLLVALVRFDNAPVDVDATTRTARAARRAGVRVARDFIHTRLAEPLQLSELCRHAQLKVRSLEYGFQEVTGLTPIAYIRSLRLNAARKALQRPGARPQRSISEIAMDSGFWHLSQFATDYRRFFGETPSQTRQRSLTKPDSFTQTPDHPPVVPTTPSPTIFR